MVLLAQVLPPKVLALLCALGGVACGAVVRAHFLQILRRSRWILLTLLLTYLLLTPGERIWTEFPISKEGVVSGVEHLMRLLAILLLVAWLVGGRPDQWLLSAMWGLLPKCCIASGQRFIVRLALTLRYSTGGKIQSWRSMLLPADECSLTTVAGSIDLSHKSLTTGERWASVGLVLAGLSSFWVLA